MADNSKPIVFVITPFNDDFTALFAEFEREFGADYKFTNAGDLDNQQNIIQDIVEGIATADVVIADLSGLNANVFYELGLAHAMNKKVIIITQDIGELPFDIKSYRATQSSLQFNKIRLLMQELRKLLNGAIDGSVKYGNPVSDYAPSSLFSTGQINERCACEDHTLTEQTQLEEEDDADAGEGGFLDYVATICEESTQMTEEINSMKDDVVKLGDSVNASSAEINRVKASSGTADPVFVRNVCRKLAVPVGQLGDQMRERTAKIRKCWDKIESNYLDMLDCPVIKTSSNKESIQTSGNSLQRMREAIRESNGSIESFIVSLQSCQGMERRLNKSINALISVLQDYLTTTEMISASADRITRKIYVVLDEIEMQ